MSNYIRESRTEFENSRAWCSKCFNFFDSNPKSEICQKHVARGNCNLFNCKRENKKCVRKFAKNEDEQVHSVCLTKEDVLNLDEDKKIQNFIQTERLLDNSSENSSLFFKKIQNIAINPWETHSENDSTDKNIDWIVTNNLTNSAQNSNMIKSKIDSIFSLNKEDCQLIQSVRSFTNINGNFLRSNMDSNLNNDKITPKNRKETNSLSKKDFYLLNETIVLADYDKDQVPNTYHIQQPEKKLLNEPSLSIIKNFDKLSLKSSISNQNNQESIKNRIEINKDSVNIFNNPHDHQYFIEDQITIEEILDIVYNETRIAKTALKKIKSGFKKRGWNNAKIIRLLHEKYKNWEFFYDPDIKSICTQSEAICISIENLLQRIN